MAMELLYVSNTPGEDEVAKLRQAAIKAFGGSTVRCVPGAEGLKEEGTEAGWQMVVLKGGDLSGEQIALSILDSQLLPRWPVWVWDAPANGDGDFAGRLKDAWNAFQLRRENARLRGEMKTLARRINHDLRSPLGGITTTAELLVELLGESNKELVPLTTPLFDSTQTMVRLMDRISFAARAGAEPVPLSPLAMLETVWAAEQRLQRPIMERKIQVVHPESWPIVPGVAPWLEVVWWNLLANAVVHSPTGGSITLSWEKLGEDQIRFGVTDAGSGVPEARRHFLFYPFHLLHQPGSPHGLGLPIVRHLVELQGGSCGAEFPPEGGSFFHFTLAA